MGHMAHMQSLPYLAQLHVGCLMITSSEYQRAVLDESLSGRALVQRQNTSHCLYMYVSREIVG